jgi:hypothetical protein
MWVLYSLLVSVEFRQYWIHTTRGNIRDSRVHQLRMNVYPWQMMRYKMNLYLIFVCLCNLGDNIDFVFLELLAFVAILAFERPEAREMKQTRLGIYHKIQFFMANL